MKYFTPAIDKYFASWILPRTWNTPHPCDQSRFYRFIVAIDHFSKPIKRRPLDVNDPHLAQYPAELRADMAKALVGKDRNPRTSDERLLKQRIALAVKRNHPDFDETYAAKIIDSYIKKAMVILDALWAVRQIGFPRRDIQKWDPPLK